MFQNVSYFRQVQFYYSLVPSEKVWIESYLHNSALSIALGLHIEPAHTRSRQPKGLRCSHTPNTDRGKQIPAEGGAWRSTLWSAWMNAWNGRRKLLIHPQQIYCMLILYHFLLILRMTARPHSLRVRRIHFDVSSLPHDTLSGLSNTSRYLLAWTYGSPSSGEGPGVWLVHAVRRTQTASPLNTEHGLLRCCIALPDHPPLNGATLTFRVGAGWRVRGVQ